MPPFFACYLLTPVNPPQRLRCTYVGFTVTPTRRIRQHNGELVSGAKRTTRHRPWEMITVVHGFPTKFHALQFEYAWQHPYVCRFTRERLSSLKHRKGIGHPCSVKRKLVELHEMLHVLPWSNFPLTVTYTSQAMQNLVRVTSFFTWPQHMTCELRPLQDLRALEQRRQSKATRSPSSSSSTATTTRTTLGSCYVCDESLSDSTLVVLRCYHDDCGTLCHSLCLADHFLLEQAMAEPCAQNASETESEERLRPERGSCPRCRGDLLWPLVVAHPVSLERASAQRTTDETAAVAEDPHASDQETERYSDSGWFEDDDDDDDAMAANDDEEEDASPHDEEVSHRRPSDDQRKEQQEEEEIIDLTVEDEDDDDT